MIITEDEMLKKIKKAKKILLLEPEYKRKYMPLSLAKISTFAKANGAKVKFLRKYDGCDYDLVCVTTLFTYDSEIIARAINSIDGSMFHKRPDVLVGGVYATLMSSYLDKNTKKEISIFKGYSQTLDMVIPDYSIDWKIEEPWDEFSYLFSTRGCPNRCKYCTVWRIEPELWINPNWKKLIVDSKSSVMLSDNNLSSQPIEHIKEVINYLIKKNKKVVFDNGFDCKHVTKDMAKVLAKLSFTRRGMRLAFDRIEEDGIFQKAIKRLLKAGVKKKDIMAYVLFNFHDTPREADYRMKECVKLGIRPYPQQYQPLNQTNRKKKYIGKHWTKNLLKIFRYFWLMAGEYTTKIFDDFLKENKKGFKLLRADKDAYYNSKINKKGNAI